MELDDAGAEIAVAGPGYGARLPEAGGGEQGTPAKECARCGGATQARHGAHYLWAQLRRACAPDWVHHRAGGGSADIGTASEQPTAPAIATARLPLPATNGQQLPALEVVFEASSELEFDETANRARMQSRSRI